MLPHGRVQAEQVLPVGVITLVLARWTLYTVENAIIRARGRVSTWRTCVLRTDILIEAG